MNPLTLLEKTINERGSSVILLQCLALVKEQFADTELRLKNALEDALNDATEAHSLISILKRENDILKQDNEIHNRKKDYSIRYSCLLFHDNPSILFCPKCFFDHNKKIPTSRKSSKFRYCPVCKSDIPSG